MVTPAGVICFAPRARQARSGLVAGAGTGVTAATGAGAGAADFGAAGSGMVSSLSHSASQAAGVSGRQAPASRRNPNQAGETVASSSGLANVSPADLGSVANAASSSAAASWVENHCCVAGRPMHASAMGALFAPRSAARSDLIGAASRAAMRGPTSV